jgi:MFS family permease
MTELREGVRLVFQHPLLRSLLAMMTSDAVAQQLAIPIFLVFFYRSLHLAPAEAGLVFAAFGVGSIAGSLVAARAVALLGLGRMMAIGITGSAVAFLMIPFALFLPAVPWLVLTGLIDGVSITAMDIQQVSLRQEVTPHRLQGRMNATFRTLFWGVWPIANFLGGFLADRIGAAAVILIAGGLRVVPITIVLLSPIGRLRGHSEVQTQPADAG